MPEKEEKVLEIIRNVVYQKMQAIGGIEGLPSFITNHYAINIITLLENSIKREFGDSVNSVKEFNSVADIKRTWYSGDENNDNIKTFILDALHTAGSHHKQWYLEQAIKVLDPDIKCTWEPGVLP